MIYDQHVYPRDNRPDTLYVLWMVYPGQIVSSDLIVSLGNSDYEHEI